MHSLRKLTALITLALSLLVISCTPTTQGEQARWERNVARSAKLKAKYPAAAYALDTQESKARTALDSAKGLSGDAAAQGMASANLSFERVINPIEDFDNNIMRASRLMTEIPAASMSLSAAVSSAQTMIYGVSGKTPEETAAIFDAA